MFFTAGCVLYCTLISYVRLTPKFSLDEQCFQLFLFDFSNESVFVKKINLNDLKFGNFFFLKMLIVGSGLFEESYPDPVVFDVIKFTI